MKKSFLLALIAVLSLTNCQQDDKKPLLIGKWQAVSWTVRGKESGRDFKSIHFDFNADDTYSAAFGGQAEQGKFRLAGDKLYTTGENKIEKMVKLATFTADTIVMDMNRAGEAEALILVKK
jgi:hypothetical protein